MDATFVGNPLLDPFGQDLLKNVKTYADLDRRPLRVAIMPGSRMTEIQTLWPPMQHVALHLRQHHPDVRFVTVAHNEQRREHLAAAAGPWIYVRVLDRLGVPGHRGRWTLPWWPAAAPPWRWRPPDAPWW